MEHEESKRDKHRHKSKLGLSRTLQMSCGKHRQRWPGGMGHVHDTASYDHHRPWGRAI